MQGFLIGLSLSMDLQVLVDHEPGLIVLSKFHEVVRILVRRQLQEIGNYK